MIKSYGIPGESQETRTELNLGAPYIMMQSDRPEPHYVATEQGEWVVPEDTREYKHFTGLAKLDLFTPAEQQAVIAAVYGGDAEVAVFYERFKIADYVTYSNPETEIGLQLLVDKDLITEARKEEIIAEMTAEREV